ncbi:hypothetical protein P9294_gp150 [Bacillus phage FADO]|uniref:Prohead protease n=1 Tax=Bacillus phage FADO TaxID=2917160 RepID=A0AAE9K5U9_9CAUD|nr:hypothetical protein P9294_gp150 [Bacillus phage FADO]UNY48865.1 hypothetical protein fado_150 [Bacillus phage FADO]
MGKRLDFSASISDVKQVNPLFSTCKVRVLYTGKNRNMSIITKDAVEKALPTLKNIPIVGEYSENNHDFKGHGGALDLDSYKFIHTTKPYGVVPESATYSWEKVEGRDGATREYLTIDGCYLWTGRYEEAYSIIENGKGQSMEIEIINGQWDESQEAYQINDFTFSALCILGDEVEPAFEDANITAYSLSDSFNKEFSTMLSELQFSLEKETVKEELKMNLEELLAKYSVSLEELEAEGIEYKEVPVEELEASLKDFAKKKKKKDEEDEEKDKEKEKEDQGGGGTKPNLEDKKVDQDPEKKKTDDNLPADEDEEDEDEEDKKKKKKKKKKFSNEDYEELLEKFSNLESKLASLQKENSKLVAFKEAVEEKAREEAELAKKKEHEEAVQNLFSKFQLSAEDVEGLDIHKFSVEEIEEKCYAILGRKLASKKNFSREDKSGSIHLPLNKEEAPRETSPYGDLFERLRNK